MKKKFDVTKFREEASKLSLEELEKMAAETTDGITKMILDSDLILKAAIIDTLIKERKGE